MRFGKHILQLTCGLIGSGAFPTHAADTPPASNPPPATARAVALPPLPKSPIEYFRQLLALDPGEAERALTDRPEAQQQFLKTKLQEYAALAPEDRQLRLRATELRWYLRPLMEASPEQRLTRLAAVPEEHRKLVEERLDQWDLLPRDVQKEVFENEWTVHYFLRLESSTPAQRDALLLSLASDRREKLEKGLANWLALPQEQRQRMSERFHQFFELPPKEKEKTLNALPETERDQMQETLLAFARLPAEQRRVCLNSFRKFAGMSPEERAQFLKSAERWQSMTPADRQTWRSLVHRLPPLPPGFGQPPLPLPLQLQKRAAPPPLPSTPSAGTNAGG